MRAFAMAATILVFHAAVGGSRGPQELIFEDGFEWNSTCAWSSEIWYLDLDSDTFGDALDLGAPSLCDPDFRVPNNLDCDDGDGNVNPLGQESCNGLDDDCDGATDSADPSLILVSCENQIGVCSGSTKPPARCVGGVWNACSMADYAQHSSSYEASETSCDSLDNDCDGLVDEDCGRQPQPIL